VSLRGKDFRCELDPEIHEALRVMAEHQNKPLQVLGAELLEKAIAGESHAFKVMLSRLQRCGILRGDAGNGGKGRT
jgi:hypothetical protein